MTFDELISLILELKKNSGCKSIKLNSKFIKKNDYVIITAGLPFGNAGMTNMIRLYKVGL